MQVIKARNAHEALPLALKLLEQSGVRRDSRNGPVIMIPEPVTIVYERPCERVVFWPERDANPFFHLAESLWMLAGRNDVALPERYAKRMGTYSDDGETLHGAYGYRWRSHFGVDQLAWIIQKLKGDPNDRRCVLAIWDARMDLMRTEGKDLPCNIIATLSRNPEGALDLTVFQRSGDAIWGVLGANCVHLSIMQEYVALAIGCSVGSYHQVVTNFHAYVDVFNKLNSIRPDRVNYIDNPYRDGRVYPAQMFHGTMRTADERIEELLFNADHGLDRKVPLDEPFFQTATILLQAHQAWRVETDENRFLIPLGILRQGHQHHDWIVAATQWIERRHDAWKQRFRLPGDENHQ